MSAADPAGLLESRFGGSGEIHLVEVPGRVNLIGEHIDYHGLAVLPMAIERRVRVAFRARGDARIRAVSGDGYGEREFEWTPGLKPGAAGDWENYVKAAAEAVGGRWGLGCGVDAAVISDLPPAAGLSSSSALLVAFTLGLLWANGRKVSLEELMEVLPEGEYFVGTRGGGMDHAACLASRAGCASLIEFVPFSVRPIPMPEDWGLLVAHSLTTAEKSGAAREEYNARRAGGSAALKRLGFASYREAIQDRSFEELSAMAARGLESKVERDSFLHTTGDALRVRAAVAAMERGDALGFGCLLCDSHASARDLLRISSPALDQLVEAAMDAGALGARLTGAGFGGCAIVFALRKDLAQVRAGLIARYYAGREEFVERDHLIDSRPAAGALELLGEK